MTLLLFILILSILVLVHEFGHFITAKKSGIKVEEFGMGIPPRLFGKKIGDTIYSLNWLPFGGFVRLYGEDSVDKKYAEDPLSFISKPWYKRVIVISAGVIMNFLLSIVIYYIFLSLNHYRSFTMPLMFDYNFPFGTEDKRSTVIMGIVDNSNADDSGISLGDTVLQVNGVSVATTEDIKRETGKNKDTVKVLVERYPSQEIKEYSFRPMLSEKGEAVLGVYLGDSVVLSYNSPKDRLLSGVLHSYNVLSYSVHSLGAVISTSFKSRDITPVSESVSGPVGIYNVVGGILTYSKDRLFLSILDFVAMLSLSLGFLNILPIPALDGGRLLFIVIELIRGGKRVNQEFEAKIHGLGMALLLGLFVLITIKDILL